MQGAAGLSRAAEYCLAFPKAKVLVLCVELCSLTFQKNDRSKSNLVGTSLFADGIASVLMVGDDVKIDETGVYPTVLGTQSTLMKDSEDVMGWEVKNEGLYVVFPVISLPSSLIGLLQMCTTFYLRTIVV